MLVAIGENDFVEPGDAVGGGFEIAEQGAREARGEGQGCGEFGPPVELFELQVVGGGRVGVGLPLLGEASESVALEGAEAFLQLRGFGDGEELFGVVGDCGADGVEFFGAGHVDAAGDADVAVGDFEVVAGAGVAGKFLVGEGGADVGFVGGFIAGEAGVAVDAIDEAGGVVGDVV